MSSRARVFLALLLAFLFASPPVARAQAQRPYVPGELIIKYKAGASANDRAQARASVHARFLRDFAFIRAEHVQLDGETVENAIGRLRNNPKIEYAEPNYEIHSFVTPNDTRFSELWGMRNTGQTGGTAGADIKATQAWDLFTGDPDLKVGVIDTGVDYNHPDLAANIWTNPGEIPGNGIDDDHNGYVDDVHGYDFYNNDGDPFDDNGHGSHVSGTIAGEGNNNLGVAGVCWHAKIVAIKFLSSGGSGSTAGAIAGVQYAITVGVRLTSNSWGGGGFSQALLDAINAAGAAGQLFVAAAGNSSQNTDTSPSYPAAYDSPYIISVAATDHNDNLASFSNYGATTVDIAAPGVNVLSCQPGGGYQFLSGTSMATPHVSGVVALTWGRYPALTNLQVKTMLLAHADPKPQLAGKCLTGGRLNAFMAIAEPDSVPPGAISDLATTNPGSNTMGLAWTATGDDGTTGRASRYEIRYATTPITNATWASATLVTGPDPHVAGTPESFEVGTLAFSTTYYFAIKAFDEFSNAGPLSNVATGTTLGAPHVAASPGTFAATLLTGATQTEPLTLTNQGQGTLDFTIPTPELQFTQPVTYPYTPVAKGAPDVAAGPPVTQGHGGPDGFGYRWVDSHDAGGPTFQWADITGSGTPVALSGDDATSADVPIGFAFPFYGVNFNSVRICTNGWLSFTDGSTLYDNQGLPSSGAPANVVAPMWDDFDFGAAQRAYTYNDGTRFIVSWVNVPMYQVGGSYTFQAILYPTGEIRFQYLSLGSPANSATAGVQNGTKNVGLTVVYNNTYLANDLAVKIVPLSQWLTVSPVAGRIPAGQSQNLNVTFNALGMNGGSYSGNVRVNSNDPDQNPLLLPASLHVIGAPDLAVNPAALDFGTIFAGATKTLSLTVSNPGTDVLHVTSVTTPDPSVTADAASFTLAPREARNLVVTWHPASPATLAGPLSLASDDPDTPVKTVALTGQAVPAPSFAVSPEQLDVALLTNTATTRTLRITNSGGSDYIFTAEPLVITPSGTVTVHTDADNVAVAKGAPDVQFGPAPLRAGGPDVFGYTYQDSDEPTGPSFSWVDIRSVGTAINLTGDDANAGPLPIGFSFPFYGKTFGTFRVCTNGWLSFTSSGTAYSNTALPNTGSGVPENLLAMFWDDLYFYSGSRAYYYNDGTRLIVQYQGVSRISDSANPNTFEVLLYPNGTIVYQYLSMRAATKNSATIGIQNEARNDGLQVAYNANYVKDNLAIRFRPPARFLTVTPTAGTVHAGAFMDLNVGFNASGLFGGLYQGAVRIRGNDPILPQKDVPANLTVTGVPDVVLSPGSLDFGNVFIGFPLIRQLAVQNIGTDNLVISNITLSDPAYGVNPTTVTVPPLGTAMLDVSFNPGAAGSAAATLHVMSNDPDTPDATIAVSGTGLVAPDISSSPAAISASLAIPGTTSQPLTIHNTGGSPLNFVIGTQISAASVPQYGALDLGKEEPDPRQGVLGNGGPDVYGYTWRDSDEPGGPAFDWVDITGIGAPITLPGTGDDQNVQGIPIGFDFPFYGTTFTTVNVCSNGWLSFTNTGTSLSNNPLPSSGSPENLLAAFWDDLNPGSATTRLYRYSDGTRFILSFVAVPRYSSGGPYTFQVILYPSGRILYQYLDMQGTRLNEATIGIQNAGMNDGLTVAYNNNYVHNNLAVELSVMPEYLTVHPSTGTVPAGGSMDVAVDFDTHGLFGGTYDGALKIQSNDPDEAVFTVPTHLVATGTPQIAAAPASLDFDWVYVGLHADRALKVSNAGSDVLTITGAGFDNPDYQLVGATFPITLGNRGTTTLTVRFTPAAGCTPCTGNLRLASNDPGTPNLLIPLTGIGRVPPEIALTPTQFRAALATTLGPTALSTTKLLVIENSGGSDLDWTAEAFSALPASTGVEATENGKNDPGSPGGPVAASHGGPDAAGYRWADSDDPLGPAFEWVDITGVGTPIPLNGDDQNLGPFPIPFPFPFYGHTFNSFRISSNGFLSFTSTASALTNYLLPNTSAPENLIAAFWDDLDFRSGSGSGRAYSYYDGAKFIVSFVNVPHYSSGGPYTFQVLLYPSGTVDVQYLDMQGSRLNEATIGIQNSTKDVGLTVVYNAAYMKNHLRVRFSQRPGWLTVSPAAGVTPAGGRDTVLVRFDATGLADGDFDGAVRIACNDLDEPSTTIPAFLHVGVAPARFDLDPNALSRSANGNWVAGIVTPPGGALPNTIRTSSVLVQRTVPVAAGAPVSYLGPDAYYKFDRLGLLTLLPTGNAVPVEVIGEVTDVTWFAAWDSVRVLKPKVASSLATYGTGGAMRLGAGTNVLLAWSDEPGFPATGYDLWYSADAGESWTAVAQDLQEQSFVWRVPDEATQSGLVEVDSKDALGIMGSWVSDVFTVMNGITGVENGSLPTEFALRFASANPARGWARVELSLPQASPVSVRIFDVRGRLVRSLADGSREAGRHMLSWNGTDERGNTAGPGVYFLRAHAGSFEKNVRFVLIR